MASSGMPSQPMPPPSPALAMDGLTNFALEILGWTPSRPCLFPTQSNKRCAKSYCVDAQLTPAALKRFFVYLIGFKRKLPGHDQEELLVVRLLDLIHVARCATHIRVTQSEDWLWWNVVWPLFAWAESIVEHHGQDIDVLGEGYGASSTEAVAADAESEKGLKRVLGPSTFTKDRTAATLERFLQMMASRRQEPDQNDFLKRLPRSDTHNALGLLKPQNDSQLDEFFDFDAASAMTSSGT